jgi:uncharacterized protein involved in outer membrane biogenesis
MRRWWMWLVGAGVLLMVAAVVGTFFIDEPLRRYLERQMNARLQGYTVHIGALDLRPLGFAVDLHEVVIVQDAHPDPPIIRVPELRAGVQWRALLSGRVVADVHIERPAVHMNLTQLRQEAQDAVPVQERGWQEAVHAVSPLQFNELRVVDGEFTYIDADPRRPLRLTQLNVHAVNIRNVESAAGAYPSDLQVDAVLDGVGQIALNGQADFLAAPHAAVRAELTLEQIELAQFQAIARRHNVALKRGVLSAAGTIEYAPTVKIVHLRQATIDRLHADYIHTAETAAGEKQRVQQGKQVAQEVGNAPGILLRTDQLRLVRGLLDL